MPTPTFTDGIEVVNGDVIQADEINAIQQNTENLKARKLEMGLLDTDDFANGFQEVFGKKASNLTTVSLNPVGINDNTALTPGDVVRTLYEYFTTVDILFPDTSNLNDGLFLANLFSDINNVIVDAKYVITTEPATDSDTKGYNIETSIMAVSLTGFTVKIRFTFTTDKTVVSLHNIPTISKSVVGHIHWSAKGSY